MSRSLVAALACAVAAAVCQVFPGLNCSTPPVTFPIYGGLNTTSVYLAADSPLFKFVVSAQTCLQNGGAHFNNSHGGPHIKIGDKTTPPGVLEKRSWALQGQNVTFSASTLCREGGALAVDAPFVEGFGQTHMTIAFNGSATGEFPAWAEIVLGCGR